MAASAEATHAGHWWLQQGWCLQQVHRAFQVGREEALPLPGCHTVVPASPHLPQLGECTRSKL